MASIDRADWHYDADDFPEDVPEENGASHIGWFVRWAIGRGLFVKDENTPDEMIEAVRGGTMSGRDFVLGQLDGKLWPSDLSQDGQAFAEAQYNEYLCDVGELTITLELDNGYYIEDNEANYRRMATALDERWARYIAGTSAKH